MSTISKANAENDKDLHSRINELEDKIKRLESKIWFLENARLIDNVNNEQAIIRLRLEKMSEKYK